MASHFPRLRRFLKLPRYSLLTRHYSRSSGDDISDLRNEKPRRPPGRSERRGSPGRSPDADSLVKKLILDGPAKGSSWEVSSPTAGASPMWVRSLPWARTGGTIGSIANRYEAQQDVLHGIPREEGSHTPLVGPGESCYCPPAGLDSTRRGLRYQVPFRRCPKMGHRRKGVRSTASTNGIRPLTCSCSAAFGKIICIQPREQQWVMPAQVGDGYLGRES